MIVHQDSLEWALCLAVAAQAKSERERGYTADSAILVTLRAALEAVQGGEDLNLNPSTRKVSQPPVTHESGKER